MRMRHACGALLLGLVVAGPAPAADQLPTMNSIPLCAGLTVVTAVSQVEGDYESIKKIESMNRDTLRLRYSSESMQKDELSDEAPHLVQNSAHRTLRLADLATSTQYEQQFYAGLPELIPGTTALGASAAVLRALKSPAGVEFGIFIGFVGEPTLDHDSPWYLFNNEIKGQLTRVGTGPLYVPVLVDDRLVNLPAIRAAGEFDGEKAEFYFLDDQYNPLTLRYRYGIGSLVHVENDQIVKGGANGRSDRDTFEVVKINTHCDGAAATAGAPQPASALEESLAKTGKAVTYAIYFSFNSATIREESEAALNEIASALRHHPDWKLQVNGHTDGVGGAVYNLDLSKRRAAAVKSALVSRFKIETGRLNTDGFGLSQPQDSNATLVGRAHNRRVELIRQ